MTEEELIDKLNKIKDILKELESLQARFISLRNQIGGYNAGDTIMDISRQAFGQANTLRLKLAEVRGE